MKLLAFDLPDSQADAAAWLERHLIGLELSDLVTELAAVHGAARPTESVRAVLGDFYRPVLDRGLVAADLPPRVFRQLLTQPFHLFELQEQVFTQGGAYWRGLESSAEVRARVEAGWRRVRAGLTEPAASAPAPLPPPASRPWFTHPGPWLLALVAAVLAAAGTWAVVRGRPAPPAVWGWNRPDALDRAATPQAYLDRLADRLDEWKAVAPPADGPNRLPPLAARLLELRSGLTRAAIADHPTPQSDDLKVRAALAGQAVDKLVQGLEGGRLPERVAEQADELVRELAAALRTGRLK